MIGTSAALPDIGQKLAPSWLKGHSRLVRTDVDLVDHVVATTGLTPAEAASYIFTVVAKQLPPSAKNAEASIIGDRLYVRSEVELKDFGGSKSLGPIGMLLGERDSVRLGGSINMLRPGVAEFLVQEVKLGRIEVPKGLIPRLLTQMKRGKTVEGVSQNGLPMVMPSYISDVRISEGKITLYKSVR